MKGVPKKKVEILFREEIELEKFKKSKAKKLIEESFPPIKITSFNSVNLLKDVIRCEVEANIFHLFKTGQVRVQEQGEASDEEGETGSPPKSGMLDSNLKGAIEVLGKGVMKASHGSIIESGFVKEMAKQLRYIQGCAHNNEKIFEELKRDNEKLREDSGITESKEKGRKAPDTTKMLELMKMQIEAMDNEKTMLFKQNQDLKVQLRSIGGGEEGQRGNTLSVSSNYSGASGKHNQEILRTRGLIRSTTSTVKSPDKERGKSPTALRTVGSPTARDILVTQSNKVLLEKIQALEECVAEGKRMLEEEKVESKDTASRLQLQNFTHLERIKVMEREMDEENEQKAKDEKLKEKLEVAYVSLEEMNSKHDEMEQHLKLKKIRLEEIENECSHTRGKAKELDDDKSALIDDLKIKQSKISELTSNLTELDDLREQNINYQKQINDLINRNRVMNENIEGVTQKITEGETEAERLGILLAEAEGNLGEKGQEIIELKKENSSLDSHIKLLQVKMNNDEKVILTHEKQEEMVEIRIAQLDKERDIYLDKISERENKIKILETEGEELKSDLQNARTNVKTHNQKIELLQYNKEKMEQMVQSATDQYEGMKNKMEEINIAKSKFEVEEQSYKETIISLKADLQTGTELYQRQKEKIVMFESEIDEAEINITQLQEDKTKILGDYNKCKKALEEIKEELGRNEKENSCLKEKNEVLGNEDTIQILGLSNQQLERHNRTMECKLKETMDNLEDISEKYNKLNRSYEEENNNWKLESDTLNKSIESLKDEIGIKDSRVNKLSSELHETSSTKEENTKEHENTKSTLAQAILNLQTHLATEKLEKEKVQTESTKVQNDLEKQILEYEENHTQLKNNVQVKDSDLKRLETVILNEKENVKSKELIIEGYQQKVRTIENDSGKTENTMKEIMNRCEELENDLQIEISAQKGLKEDRDKLRGELNEKLRELDDYKKLEITLSENNAELIKKYKTREKERLLEKDEELEGMREKYQGELNETKGEIEKAKLKGANQILDTEHEISSNRREIKSLTEKLTRKDEEAMEWKKSFTETEKTRKQIKLESEKRTGELQKENQILIEEKLENSKLVTKTQSENYFLAEAKSNLENSLSQKQDEIQRLNKDKSDNICEIDNLRGRFNEKEEESRNKVKQLSECEKEIIYLREEGEERKNKYEKDREEKDTEIYNLTKNIKGLESDIALKNDDLEYIKGQLATLEHSKQAAVTDSDTVLTQTQNELKLISSEKHELHKKLTQAQTECGQITEENKSLSSQVSIIQSEINTLRTTNDKLSKDNDKLNYQVDNLATGKVEKSEELSKLNIELNNLKDSIKGVNVEHKEEIEHHLEEINRLKKAIQRLESAIALKTADLEYSKSQNSRLEQIKKELSGKEEDTRKGLEQEKDIINRECNRIKEVLECKERELGIIKSSKVELDLEIVRLGSEMNKESESKIECNRMHEKSIEAMKESEKKKYNKKRTNLLFKFLKSITLDDNLPLLNISETESMEEMQEAITKRVTALCESLEVEEVLSVDSWSQTQSIAEGESKLHTQLQREIEDLNERIAHQDISFLTINSKLSLLLNNYSDDIREILSLLKVNISQSREKSHTNQAKMEDVALFMGVAQDIRSAPNVKARILILQTKIEKFTFLEGVKIDNSNVNLLANCIFNVIEEKQSKVTHYQNEFRVNSKLLHSFEDKFKEYESKYTEISDMAANAIDK